MCKLFSEKTTIEIIIIINKNYTLSLYKFNIINHVDIVINFRFETHDTF